MNQTAANAPSTAVPARRPSTIDEAGDRRREQAVDEAHLDVDARARSPPLFPASSVDWIIAPASMKSRKLSTGGKPGRSTARPGAAGLDREQQGREDDDRRDQLRPAERLPDRAARRAPRRPARSRPGDRSRRRLLDGLLLVGVLGALEVVAGLLDEDVVERRLHEVERLDGHPRVVERAYDGRDVRRRRGRASIRILPSLGGSGRPKRSQTDSAASGPPSASVSSRCGLPISAFSAGRRALGHDPALVDDPDAVRRAGRPPPGTGW